MGYSTDFAGEFEITPQLSQELVEQLNKFCSCRHEDRGAKLDIDFFNRSYNGPLQDTYDIGIWCNWAFDNVDGNSTTMHWNEVEKAYYMDEWAEYIVQNFIPEGHLVNGRVEAFGEDHEDRWAMEFVDSKFRTIQYKLIEVTDDNQTITNIH